MRRLIPSCDATPATSGPPSASWRRINERTFASTNAGVLDVRTIDLDRTAKVFNDTGPEIVIDGETLLNPFPLVNIGSIGGLVMPWLMLASKLVLHHPFDLGIFLRQIAEIIVYDGVDHAFFNDTRPEVYNAEAAKMAWSRAVAFIRQHTVAQVPVGHDAGHLAVPGGDGLVDEVEPAFVGTRAGVGSPSRRTPSSTPASPARSRRPRPRPGPAREPPGALHPASRRPER